jgi:CxxC motif-containing protein
MAEISEIICVTCPQGCLLKVKHEGKDVLEVLDNGCKRGKEYAICELQDPRRMVASTVKVTGGLHPLVPVYTRSAFPKPLIPQLAKQLRQVEVNAPVEINQVVLADALGTGIDVVTSRDMPKA